MRHLAVIAPRRASDARAAVVALRALLSDCAFKEVTVFAEEESRELLEAEGVSALSLERGVRASLSTIAAEGVVLLDPLPRDAVDARAAGVKVRVGWGSKLGALTHAVRPARRGGREFIPDLGRTYLDVIGLCGVLSAEERRPLLRALPRGRVLIRLPNWLGDLVQCEPLLRVFGETAERLTLVGPASAAALFGGTLAGATWLGSGEGARAWRGHDLALLLDGSLRSAWRAARARIGQRVSWARGGKSPWLTDAIHPARELGLPAMGCGVKGSSPRWLPRPFAVSAAELASAAGIGVALGAPCLRVSEAGRAEAEVLLSRAGLKSSAPFVLGAVGGREGSAKAIPCTTWSALLEALRSQSGVQVLLTSGPGEEAQLEELVQLGLPSGISVIGTTGLEALSGLLDRASAVVTADSGPRHLAAALGRPSVVLHGPTDPRHSGVMGAPIRVSRLPVPCGPCHLERCPISGPEHLACFDLRHAEPVAAMLCELLASETPAPITP